ncbi:MAG: Carboxylesterase NlhH [Nitrospira sp.]|nr:Carboxylesterase NlhH [Nitrospira sp.]
MNELDESVLALLQEVAPSDVRPFSELSVIEARDQADLIVANIACLLRGVALPEMNRVHEVQAGNVPGRVYVPSTHPLGTILYYHGGGWVLGNIDDYDAIARTLAFGTNFSVVLVDYRKAPEDPFPAAVDDCWASLTWAAAQKTAGHIVVAGDSAGANLATVTAIRSRDEDGPPIALQVLVHPVTDFSCRTESFERWQDGPVVTKADIEWFWGHYLGEGRSIGSNPLASPLRADSLSGLPPALVILAECDPAHDDGLLYAQRLNQSGVRATVHEFSGVPHTFLLLTGLLPAANAALDVATREIIGLSN